MRITDEQTGQTTEKWILRKACQDLLPHDLVWREKAQFDEGTGTVDSLDEALSIATGTPAPVDRQTEARLYHDILCEQFENPEMILQNAGTWTEDRVRVSD
jgi:asparagine synthase (glutamine-hydrolysing)